MEIQSRHHLRSDAVDDVETAVDEGLGVELDADNYELVELGDSPFDLVLVDGEPLVLYHETPGGNGEGDREPFLTVKGANAHPPERRVVTVDAGAVEFVTDGADVMRPGIVDADEEIAAGDLVAVNEETHGKFLAVGRALVDGTEMLGEEGRVVEALHHVGDDLYGFSV